MLAGPPWDVFPINYRIDEGDPTELRKSSGTIKCPDDVFWLLSSPALPEDLNPSVPGNEMRREEFVMHGLAVKLKLFCQEIRISTCVSKM